MSRTETNDGSPGLLAEALYSSAKTLADTTGGLFVAYEPDRFSFQSLPIIPMMSKSHFRADGKPIEIPDDSDIVAGVVDPRYAKLPDRITEHDADTGSVFQIGQVLRSRQNVTLGFEHSELIDIALGQVAISNHLRRRKVEHYSAMVVSKAIDFLGINVEALSMHPDFARTYLSGLNIEVEDDNTVPVRKFLGLAAHAVYMTIPSTKTFADIRGIKGLYIKEFNREVTSSLARSLRRSHEPKRKPILLGVAVPGTTVKMLDAGALNDVQIDRLGISDFANVDVIGRISSGIGGMIGDSLTFPTALRLDEAPPTVMIDKEPLSVRGPEDVNRLANKLIELSEALEPGKQFIYDVDGNLPVIRK